MKKLTREQQAAPEPSGMLLAEDRLPRSQGAIPPLLAARAKESLMAAHREDLDKMQLSRLPRSVWALRTKE